MMIYANFNIIHYFSHITETAHIVIYFLGFTSSRLGLRSDFPKDTPSKIPQNPVRHEAGDSRLRVIHFTIEPRGPRNIYKP